MRNNFVMAVHFHQPVGNFDHIIKRTCEKCYLPFLLTLKKYPQIKMSFHFSGCLLEWIEANEPCILDMVRELVEKGQVEIISGAFYEPILSSISSSDAKKQINMLNEYIKKNFAFKAKGAWIAERVWEPAFASLLHDSGIEYVILDDTHFICSGFKKEDTYGYYMTENGAKAVAVFPSDKELRYHIPFKLPEHCMGYMKDAAERVKGALFIYGDDGEKFGEWPGTYKWVFEEKWLERFFEELVKNQDWLVTQKFSECLKESSPKGKAYIGTVSYDEMMEWALPADVQKKYCDARQDIISSGKEGLYAPFMRGGFWRNFFAKYPEADHMNKKMMYVSGKLEHASRVLKNKSKEMSEKLIEAEKELLRGQCNCAYWHGVFGGLYSFHLRNAIYKHLIRSEKLIDNIRYGNEQFCEVKIFDFDADGKDEPVLENRNVSLYFDPGEGGVLKEFDSKGALCNFINTLSRRKEAYHEKILKKIEKNETPACVEVKTIHDDIRSVDADLKKYLHYDWYSRASLIDHFLENDTDIDRFSRSDYNEAGDFVKEKYAFDVKKTQDKIVLDMEREGCVSGARIALFKKIVLCKEDSGFIAKYSIVNREAREVKLIFGPEFNIVMPEADSERYTLFFSNTAKLGDVVQSQGIDNVEIRDAREELSLRIRLSEKCRFWHFPIKTVSQSEKAYELNYQGSVLFPHIEFTLGAGEAKAFEIKVEC